MDRVPFAPPGATGHVTLVCSLTLLVSFATSIGKAAPIQIDSALIRTIQTVNLPAPEACTIKQIRVAEGDRLQGNTIVVEMDDEVAQHELRQAEIRLAKARAQADNQLALDLARKSLALARTELDRVNGINARIANTVPQAEVDRLTLELERAELEVEQATYQLQLAKWERESAANHVSAATDRITRLKLHAPFDATVVRVPKQAGEWVNEGETVIRLVHVGRLRAEGFLAIERASLDLIGRNATVRVVCGEVEIAVPAVVTFVDLEVDPVSSQVRVWADFDRTDLALRPGLRGQIVIDSADLER